MIINREKIEILIKYEFIDNLIFLNLNYFLNIKAFDFLKFVSNNLNLKGIVVGEGFYFGKNKEGNVNYNDFILDKVKILYTDNLKISSTNIKQKILL